MFDAHKFRSAWTLDELGTLYNWCRFDVHIMVEILFIRFEGHGILCAGDGIMISNRTTSSDGATKLYF